MSVRRAPNNGQGRPKGSLNRTTRSAREAFQYAFDAIGGAQALAEWASTNLDEFYRLYGRLIPVDHTGGIVGNFTIATGVPESAACQVQVTPAAHLPAPTLRQIEQDRDLIDA